VPLCYLGLGSNLGDRLSNLRRATEALESVPGLRVLRSSSVYETEPVGPPDQPWYLNTVVEADAGLEPEALRLAAKAIEADLGRAPGPRWGPRVIDVDILLYDSVRVRTERLVIPHPEWWNRLFVLVPLQELRPALQGPDGEPIGQRIQQLVGASPRVNIYRRESAAPIPEQG
jgi:2-amino-4-hydroxy-6-hydroxymethyldihydropteridine diphosphokinase